MRNSFISFVLVRHIKVFKKAYPLYILGAILVGRCLKKKVLTAPKCWRSTCRDSSLLFSSVAVPLVRSRSNSLATEMNSWTLNNLHPQNYHSNMFNLPGLLLVLVGDSAITLGIACQTHI